MAEFAPPTLDLDEVDLPFILSFALVIAMPNQAVLLPALWTSFRARALRVFSWIEIILFLASKID